MRQKDKGRRMKKKAQSMLEYLVVICMFVGALIATVPYLSRSLQGRFKRFERLSRDNAYSLGITESEIFVGRQGWEETTRGFEKSKDGNSMTPTTRFKQFVEEDNDWEITIFSFDSEPERFGL